MYHSTLRGREQQYRSAALAYADAQRRDPPFQSDFGSQRVAQQHESRYNRFSTLNEPERDGRVSNGRSGLGDFVRGRLSPNHYESLRGLSASDIGLDGAPFVREVRHPQSNDHRAHETITIRDRLGDYDDAEDGRRETRHSPGVSRVDPRLLDTLAMQQRREPVEPRSYPTQDSRIRESLYRNAESKRDWLSADSRRPQLQERNVSPVGWDDSRNLRNRQDIGLLGDYPTLDNRRMEDRFASTRTLMRERPISPLQRSDHLTSTRFLESRPNDPSMHDRETADRFYTPEPDEDWRSASHHPSMQFRHGPRFANDYEPTMTRNDDQSAIFSRRNERMIDDLPHRNSDSHQDWQSEDRYSPDACSVLDDGPAGDRLGDFESERDWDRIQNLPPYRSGNDPILLNDVPHRGISSQIESPIMDNPEIEVVTVNEVEPPSKTLSEEIQAIYQHVNSRMTPKTRMKVAKLAVTIMAKKARRENKKARMAQKKQMQAQKNMAKTAHLSYPAVPKNLNSKQAHISGNPRAKIQTQGKKSGQKLAQGANGASRGKDVTARKSDAPIRLAKAERIAALPPALQMRRERQIRKQAIRTELAHKLLAASQKLAELNSRVDMQAWNQSTIMNNQANVERPMVEQTERRVNSSLIHSRDRAARWAEKKKFERAEARALVRNSSLWS